jgi:hypothetical protein
VLFRQKSQKIDNQLAVRLVRLLIAAVERRVIRSRIDPGAYTSRSAHLGVEMRPVPLWIMVLVLSLFEGPVLP